MISKQKHNMYLQHMSKQTRNYKSYITYKAETKKT
jgi:hypothetical protein